MTAAAVRTTPIHEVQPVGGHLVDSARKFDPVASLVFFYRGGSIAAPDVHREIADARNRYRDHALILCERDRRCRDLAALVGMDGGPGTGVCRAQGGVVAAANGVRSVTASAAARDQDGANDKTCTLHGSLRESVAVTTLPAPVVVRYQRIAVRINGRVSEKVRVEVFYNWDYVSAGHDPAGDDKTSRIGGVPMRDRAA